jgi:hypothetical protein
MQLAPRTVGVGATPRRIGFGDDSGGLYGAVGTGTSALADSAVQSLPPDVQSAMTTGRTIISNGKPVVDLISYITSHSGQPINALELETKITAAAAGVVGMVFPPAGALMAAGGALVIGLQQGLQAIFGALGLLWVPPTTWNYVGLIRPDVDTVPYGPASPAWIDINSRLDLYNFILNGRPAVNAAAYKAVFGETVKDQTGYPALEYNGAAQEQEQSYLDLWQSALLRRSVPSKEVWSETYAYSCNKGVPNPLNSQTNGNLNGQIYCQAIVDPSLTASKWTGSGRDTTFWTSPADFKTQFADMQNNTPTDFEIFFNMILCQNLSFWGNGLPFVPIRRLLRACAQAWNATHLGPATVCFYPSMVGSAADTTPGTNIPNLGGYTPTIPFILGSEGGWLESPPELSDQPPLCVNSGPLGGVATAITPASLISNPVVAVPAVAAAGTLIYSYATGQAVETVVKNAWKWLTRG